MNFDSIDLEDSPSVSVRDLKSRIINQSKLKICQDFDLVLSNAITGQGNLKFFFLDLYNFLDFFLGVEI